MGRLVQFLKDRGEWENTLFIFTSDHGEQMGDHWMYGKAGFYDQSYHIPLIISGPGLSSGCCDAFTEHVDITPTILDLLGQSIPRQCDGHSLKNWLMKMTDANWRDSVHFEYDFRHSEAESTLDLDMESACLNVVRDHQYKYVHFANLPPLLFDLKNDPAELHNLAESEPKLVATYAGKLLSWRLATTEKSLSHFQIVREAGLINKLGST